MKKEIILGTLIQRKTSKLFLLVTSGRVLGVNVSQYDLIVQANRLGIRLVNATSKAGESLLASVGIRM